MKTNRLLILAVLLLSACTLLFASGQKAEETGSQTGSDSGLKWEGQSITAHFMDATYADFAEDIAAEFEEQMGGEVEIVTAPFSALHERYGLALRTGDDTYDVMSIASQWDGEFARWMTDLEPYLDRADDFDSDDIMEKAWNQSGRFGDKTFGIPHAYTPRLISYRTDLVDGVPETWDEFFEVAEEVHDPENDFYAFATPGNKIQLAAIFNVSLWSLDGRWADEDWNITIDSPEARQALRNAKRVIEMSDPAALSWGLPEADAAFLAGNAAFNFAWPTLGVTVDGDNPERSEIVGDWALDLYPEEETATTVLSAWDIGIPQGAENKEMAWDFIKMYTSKEAQMRAFEEYTILSPRQSFWDDPTLQNSPLAPHGEANAIFWWRIPAGEQAQTIIRDAVSNYASEQWGMERAIDYLESGLREALQQNPPPEGIPNTGR